MARTELGGPEKVNDLCWRQTTYLARPMLSFCESVCVGVYARVHVGCLPPLFLEMRLFSEDGQAPGNLLFSFPQHHYTGHWH